MICGDFNDVPNSYTYFTLKGNLQDAFLKKGSGFGRTLNFISPTLRIDYILADKELEIDRFHVIKVLIPIIILLLLICVSPGITEPGDKPMQRSGHRLQGRQRVSSYNPNHYPLFPLLEV
ncbi:MAG: hypothetical protein IPH68_13225 [Chitinophagaceae bacterium]|nr:hypothetical protein [Chitinophagaceae bacterium]